MVDEANVFHETVIDLVIPPCFVQDVEIANEDLTDFEMSIGEIETFSFTKFTQVPGCHYAITYTITLLEKISSAEVAFDVAKEGEGMFASLDLEQNILEFKPEASSLSGNTYAVFIRGSVNVTPEF